jgi:hypothetical protein
MQNSRPSFSNVTAPPNRSIQASASSFVDTSSAKMRPSRLGMGFVERRGESTMNKLSYL